MEENKSRSNEGVEGKTVEKLDTKSFNDIILSYGDYVVQFNEIVKSVNHITATMTSNWRGEGRDAFERDCRQVQLNLKDISDIMYELKQALTDAHVKYMETDSGLSKCFES